MAKYTDPACKLCRREGEKFFLKGERCFTPKCAFERRGYAPGQHGRSGGQGGRGGRGGQGRESDYAKQLRAKQKARRIYGVYEAQFRRYYGKALKPRGLPASCCCRSLNPVWIMWSFGWALHPAGPRHACWSRHGHFTVNGRRTDIPSMTLGAGDVISVRPGSLDATYFKELASLAETRNTPAWLGRDLNSLSGNFLRLPERPEIDGNLNEQLIVEYYSR